MNFRKAPQNDRVSKRNKVANLESTILSSESLSTIIIISAIAGILLKSQDVYFFSVQFFARY